MRIIEQWKTLTDKIVIEFENKYFKDNAWGITWIGWDFHVFEVNEYYFNLSDAVFCLENNVPEEKLFEWYDKSVEQVIDISLKDFLESPEKLRQQKEKHLKELEQRVKTAEEEFKKALNELS